MKFKIIFLEGLNEDELKSLDEALVPLSEANRKQFFSRFYQNAQDQRAVAVEVATNKLMFYSAADARERLEYFPEKYVKAVPQFEVKIVAKLKLPFPEEIEENGRRYRLVQE